MPNRQIPPARTIRYKNSDSVRLDEVRQELLSAAELLRLAASACRVEADSRKEPVMRAGSDLVDAAMQAVKHALDYEGEEQPSDVRLGMLRIYSLLLVLQGAFTSGPVKDAGDLVNSPLADTLELAVELAYGLAGRVSTRVRESVHSAQAAAPDAQRRLLGALVRGASA
jgi:hypothetical protein